LVGGVLVNQTVLTVEKMVWQSRAVAL